MIDLGAVCVHDGRRAATFETDSAADVAMGVNERSAPNTAVNTSGSPGPEMTVELDIEVVADLGLRVAFDRQYGTTSRTTSLSNN